MTINPEKTKLIKEKAQKRIAKRLKEGRGSGSGRDYEPYLHVRDVPSKGRSHRLPSATVGRVHHLLSDLELHIFLQLDWHEHVVDIREQFPLPIEATQKIAQEMSIAHLSHQGVDEIVTTDFLVDLNYSGKISRRAISAKYVDQLDDPRTIEKFELERRFWASKDVPFSIVTEKEISVLLKKNVQWFHPYINHYALTDLQRYEYFELFQIALQQFPAVKLTELMHKLDDQENTESGFHLGLMRHLMAQRAFSFDFETLTVQNLRARDVQPSPLWIQEDYEYVVGE